jgi:RNA polymerase sigma-70 factor, ECF subfamily
MPQGRECVRQIEDCLWRNSAQPSGRLRRPATRARHCRHGGGAGAWFEVLPHRLPGTPGWLIAQAGGVRPKDFWLHSTGLGILKGDRSVASRNSQTGCDLTTDELVQLVRAGNTDYYREIVNRYQRDVLRIVTCTLYDRSRTEDLVQQVFVNAFLHLADFELGRDFGAWLRTIARNAVREHLRNNARYEQRLKAYGDLVNQRWENDDRAVEFDESMRQALQDCMQRLPPKAARTIRLRYHEGLDFSTMAARMNTTAGALRNLLSRVRVQLRECIERGLARQGDS